MAVSGVLGRPCHHRLVCPEVCSVEHVLLTEVPQKVDPMANGRELCTLPLPLGTLDSYYLLRALKNPT